MCFVTKDSKLIARQIDDCVKGELTINNGQTYWSNRTKTNKQI